MRERYDILIVGAGHAGTQLAVNLRQRRFAGSIGIVSNETNQPYERPPLSKDYLAGRKPIEQIVLRQPDFWSTQEIELLLGLQVEHLDVDRHMVTVSDGTAIGYTKLVWAAGGNVREIECEGCDLAGIYYLRSLTDADRLREALDRASEVVVVGGGFIGLEAAATLRKLGKNVSLLENQARVLARVVAPEVSAFYENEHREHGVTLHTSTSVDSIQGCDGRACGVRLSDGRILPSDLVIVGIGIAPVVDVLRAAGAIVGNGVHVTAQCKTSLDDVYAIGDCAAIESKYAQGARVRVESIQNATDQAILVSKVLSGRDDAYSALPTFWSDQYDLRLQTVGLAQGYDEAVVCGEPSSRSFSVVYGLRDRIIAVDCINAPREFIRGRTLIVRGATVGEAVGNKTAKRVE